MGVVYAAHDERLNRNVALKMIADPSGDASARARLLREARVAASVNHPNICQLYDIGETDGQLFLVMELLEGESLTDRLERGPLPLPEVTGIGLGILTALESLHGRGMVHRDLKPSNVFLTAYGVKLLDFGLAREAEPAFIQTNVPTLAGKQRLTEPGVVVGTPRYMAPEQLTEAVADARTDVFSTGVILFEMMTGKLPFQGKTALQLFHAIVHDVVPHLGGSAGVAALSRIIHRATAKLREDRYQSASAMSQDLREVMLIADTGAPAIARRMTRLVVLPFRILRPDSETDFLAQALPDAITASLAALDSIIVRSPLAASRQNADDIDLAELARRLDVDIILTGTLLRGADRLRVTAQLVQAPEGTVLWSSTAQGTMQDILDLQDQLTRRIVASLELPLNEREQRLLRHDVPANARAHEFYLRACQQVYSPNSWAIARDLYVRALEEDPSYAPGWARLGRVHLLIGKYCGEPATEYAAAEDSLKRALEINPDLPVAHHAYAQLEVSIGRAKEAMLRLLDRLERSSDPDVLAGLVMALRYCGLLEDSLAAHEQARQLDPTISTSVSLTYWVHGDYEKARETLDTSKQMGAAAFVYASLGLVDEGIAILEQRERTVAAQGEHLRRNMLAAFRATLTGSPQAAALLESASDFPDPEGVYNIARSFAYIGQPQRALELLERAEENGFFCYAIYAHDPWLDPLRSDQRFHAILQRVEQRHLDALRAFEQHAGSRVLAVGRRR